MTTSPIVPPPSGGVLIASPDSNFREQVLQCFPDRSRPVQEALGGADALAKLATGNWQVLFLDRRLQDLDAEELVHIIKRRFPGIEVVVLDPDNGKVLPGPFPLATASYSGSKARQAEIRPHPMGAEAIRDLLPGMIGQSQPMQQVYRLVRMVARRNTTVLITGPTGTGKELVANAIHQLSPRAARPFVVVNCAAIPESLLESELFGHVRGAFTGAVQTNPGRALAAQGGTLFLDEIGELPLALQAKLLRFLELKEVQRLGSAEVLKADVRVVAATNADLCRAAEEGKFRLDLYYRLAAFPIELAALAKRRADIVPLAEHFLRSMSDSPGETPALSPAAARLLEDRQWNGNVRELQQSMERALILAEGSDTILPEHLYFLPPHPLEICADQDYSHEL